MEHAQHVLNIYHIYLSQLEAVLYEEKVDKNALNQFLNLLDCVQHEEFAYDWQNPQPRWMVNYDSLDVKAHKHMLLMHVSNEKDVLDCA